MWDHLHMYLHTGFIVNWQGCPEPMGDMERRQTSTRGWHHGWLRMETTRSHTPLSVSGTDGPNRTA